MKADGPHTAVKVGERGIADCTWLRVGCADCRMSLTAALLLLPVSFSGPHAECCADCFADCSADYFAGYSAETFVSAFVVLGVWIVVVLRTKVSLAVAAVAVVAVVAVVT